MIEKHRVEAKRWWLVFLLTAFILPGCADGGGGKEAPPPSLDPFTLTLNDENGYLFSASSTLEDEGPHVLGEYGMQTLFDGDTHTGWAEGVSGPGEQEVLWLDMADDADTLLIRNGFCRSQRLFAMNNRVRTLEVSLWRGLLPGGMVSERTAVYVMQPVSRAHTLTIEDSMDLQQISLPFADGERAVDRERSEAAFREYAEAEGLPTEIDRRRLFLRLEIAEVYPGTRWDDTCLTELRVFSRKSFAATRLYSQEGVILYDTDSRSRCRLYSDREYLYDPFLNDESGRWTVAFRTPRQVSGRTETVYELFRVPFPEPVSNADFRRACDTGRIPDRFERQGEALHLVFDDETRVTLER